MLQGAYEPHEIEKRWYDTWERSGAFRPEVAGPEAIPFTIVIPPPNVTGSLHMGHAFEHAIIDAIVRRQRMLGRAALYLPGTDHAGIATQAVVEKELAKEGTSAREIGREAFVARVWDWVEHHGGAIKGQMRRFGESCDWTRERFTLDPGLSRAVEEVFIRMHADGLIYRAARIVNWSPKLRTALSDIEVDHIDVEGELAYFTYPWADGSPGGITVATTRAETMLGDTAVVVHPDDERYKNDVGRMLAHPLLDRRIPLLGDTHVDPTFATGAVKVTPAHDQNDFEIARRHDLPAINIFDETATVNDAGGPFAGLDRFDARAAVKAALAEKGLLVKVEPHVHSVGHSSRSFEPIEPWLSMQWWVNVGPLVGPAIDAVKSDEIQFLPERWEKLYFDWMTNLRDWCISRQLWWGHRIPVWYAPDGRYVVSAGRPTECDFCDPADLVQDPDVLDTWFSSALWPFSTLGWPDDTPDLRRYYPNDLLVTGFDIIYFWVARMIHQGLLFTGQAPFTHVNIHGLIRDEHGRKMTKSRGNTLDPLELMDRYGTDPLRFTLVSVATPGQDTPWDEQKVAAAHRFGNKLWNVSRFVLANTAGIEVPRSGGYPDPGEVEADPDRWILARLHAATETIDAAFERYELAEAFDTLYHFVWDDLADWYVEAAKLALREETPRTPTVRWILRLVLRDVLALLHPAMPFLTEDLWSHLMRDEAGPTEDPHDLLITAPWPRPPAGFEGDEADRFARLQDLITSLRRFKAENKLQDRRLEGVSVAARGPAADWPQHIALLARVDLGSLSIDGAPVDTDGAARIVTAGGDVFVPLTGLVDVPAELARLERELAALEAEARRLAAKLDNQGFVTKAPAAVVEKEASRLAAVRASSAALAEQRAALGKLARDVRVNYQAALAYLDRFDLDVVRRGLERIEAVLDLLDNPQDHAPAIHVTGTNGKTSVSRIAASLLVAHGLRTGTFTSPHLQAVNERFMVDLEPIGNDAFAEQVTELVPYLELVAERLGEHPSYFEICTALAYSWFAESAVDAQVIEVGFGGRWDSTNVLSSPVAVLTNVDLDHQKFLGDTVEEIAQQKAGIIKQEAMAVTAAPRASAREIFSARAVEVHATLWMIERDFWVTDVVRGLGGWQFTLEGVHATYEDLFVPLLGRHQATNAATAVVALEAFFGRALDRSTLLTGLADATSPGRLEIVRREPLVLLDAAHNPAGCEVLGRALDEEFPSYRRLFVIGVLGADKDLGAMLAALVRDDAVVWACTPDLRRGVPAEAVAEAARGEDGAEAHVAPDVGAALHEAMGEAGDSDIVVATGSIAGLIGPARELLAG